VALQLAAMGVPTLQLIDFDTVEAVNLASQGYLLDDLGRSKVRATAEMCRLIYPDVAITQVEDRFRRRVVDVAMIDAQATVAVAAGSAQLHAQAKERAGRLIQRALTPVGWSLRLFGVDDTAIPRKQGFNE
jgi:molybdopterin/thiamine biosynthesis adenylyltransferase